MENALPVYAFSTLSGLGIPLSPVCCFLLKQNGLAAGGLKYTGRSAALSVMLSLPTSSHPPCILALRGDSGERGKMNGGGGWWKGGCVDLQGVSWLGRGRAGFILLMKCGQGRPSDSQTPSFSLPPSHRLRLRARRLVSSCVSRVSGFSEHFDLS